MLKADQLAELLQGLLDNEEMTAEMISAIALLECAKHLAIISECCDGKPFFDRRNKDRRTPVGPKSPGGNKARTEMTIMPRKQREE